MLGSSRLGSFCDRLIQQLALFAQRRDVAERRNLLLLFTLSALMLISEPPPQSTSPAEAATETEMERPCGPHTLLDSHAMAHVLRWQAGGGEGKKGPVQVQVRVQFRVGIGATAAFMAPKYSPLGFRFDKLSIK